MGDALIDELIGRGAASREQVDEAKRRQAASGGHLVERLVECGCSTDRILSAWSAATGIPTAPTEALARPTVPVGLGVPPESWRELHALPFGTDDEGNVLVAIADPSLREALEELDLPELLVHLASPEEIAAGLRRAFPALAAGPSAGPPTLPGTEASLSLVDERPRPMSSKLPTLSLSRRRGPGNAATLVNALGSSSGATAPGADDFTGEDVLRRLAAEVREEVGGRTLSHTLDDPRVEKGSLLSDPADVRSDGEGDLEMSPFEGDFEFDDPTQAVDTAALLPLLEKVGAANAKPPASEPEADLPPLSDEGFDDEFEPKTVAMSAEDIRASLKARGAATLSALRTDGSPPPSLFPDAAPSEDDEFEPKTVAMTLEEMRASLASQGTPSPAAADSPKVRTAFDFDAAADEFDGGEGSDELATAVRPRSTEQDAAYVRVDETGAGLEGRFGEKGREDEESEAPTRALIEVPSLVEKPAEDEVDDFDEQTIAADGLELPGALEGPAAFAPSLASEGADGLSSLEELDELEEPAKTEAREELDEAAEDELLFDDDSTQVRVLDEPDAAPEDEAERRLAEARTRMAAALENLDALPSPGEKARDARADEKADEGVFAEDDKGPFTEELKGVVRPEPPAQDVFASSSEELDVDATHTGLEAASELTQISLQGNPLDDDEGPGLSSPATLPLRKDGQVAAAAPEKAADTGPTGPIAVRGYDVLDVLGAGGMATVYRARQRSADREVALKILAPHLASDAAFVARFRREIRSSASLTHPNIIRVYDYGDEAGVYYMATEVMDGGSLRDALEEHGALPVPLVIKLFEHLLRGIGHAHQRGMVHRDIKPANLMLSSEGLLKLGDFGIAKSETDENLTRTGALFGTPAYMSPEQALGRAVEPPSDLFSCGIIAYELLTGENPYAAETASASLLKVSRAEAPPLLLKCPAAPPLLLEVVERLQRREPGERYATAEDALAELRPLIEAVDARYPDLVKRYVADGGGTARAIQRQHAAAELQRARHHLAADPPLRFAGAVAAFLATHLDPESAEARDLLAELDDFDFGPSANPRVHDAERSLEDEPRAPGLLKRLSDLYRAGKNPFLAAVWLRQYLAVRPTDSHARHQLGVLLGPSALAGFDDWRAPLSELSWDEVAEVLAGSEDTQVPPAALAAKEPSAELDLRPLHGGGLFAEPSPPPPPAAAPTDPPPTPSPDVRPALRTSEPSSMLRAASPRARGLQVLRAGGVEGSGPALPVEPRSPGGVAAIAPALQAAQPSYATPRGSEKPARAGLPKALKIALAAALSLALMLIIAVAVVAFSGDGTDKLVRQADPGFRAPKAERQDALVAFARERLAEGDGVRALQAASLAYRLDPASPRGGEALLVRGRASAAVGDPASAARDLESVLALFPDKGNLLHLEAQQQLKELPR